MAVDRGGLRYEIKVVVRNLRGLRQFNSQLRRTLAETKKVTSAQVQNAKQLSQLSIATDRARKERERANKAATAARVEEQRLRTEQARTAAVQRRSASQAAALAAQRHKSARATNTATRANRRYTRSLKAQNTAANRISFTFRRLFGIFAAFAAIRRVGQGIQLIVSEGIQFNAFVEEAELGIQALLAATGKVFGPDGVALQGIEKFNAVAGIARDQLEKLRLDARNTAATFRTLLETFQIALGPGLAAGLDPDQIRRLTISISQAAAAIGLPQNQLAEEIRSLLTGTIQPRTTRIATVLGITNEDVRNAKELGTLAEFLTEKFSSFGDAAGQALGNLRVLITNARDDLAKLLGAGTEEFFQSLKDSVAAFRAEIQTPAAEEFASELNDALQTTLDLFKEFASDVGIETLTELVAGLTLALGEALKIGASFAASVTKGFATALSIVARITDGIARLIGYFDGSLGLILQWVVTFRVVRALLAFILRTALGLGKAMGNAALATNAMAAGSKGAAVGIAASAVQASRLSGFVGAVATRFRYITRIAASFAGWISVALIAWDLISSLFDDAEEQSDTVKENIAEYANVSSRIPPLLLAANKALEKTRQETEKTRQEAEKLAGAFDIALATEGISKVGARAIEILLSGQQKVEEEIKKLEDQRAQKLSSIEDVQKKLLANEIAYREEVFGTTAFQKDLVDTTKRQLSLESKLLGAQAKRSELEKKFAQTPVEERGPILDKINDSIANADRLQKKINQLIIGRRQLAEAAGGGAEEREKVIVDLTEERVRLLQIVNGLRREERELADVGGERAKALLAGNEAKLGTFLVEQVSNQREQNRLLQQALQLRESINVAVQSGTDPRLAKLQAERSEILRIRDETIETRQREIDSLLTVREKVKESKALEQINKRIGTLEVSNALLRKQATLDLKDNADETNKILTTLQAVNRLNPLTTIIGINPAQIKNLETTRRLLKPIADALRSVEGREADLALRKSLGPLGEDAITIQQEFRKAEDAQIKFAENVAKQTRKVQETLDNLEQKRRATIVAGVAGFSKEIGAQLASSVEKALENPEAFQKELRTLLDSSDAGEVQQGKALLSLFRALLLIDQQRTVAQRELSSIQSAGIEGAKQLGDLAKRRLDLIREEIRLRREAETRSLKARTREANAERKGLGQSARQAQITALKAQIQNRDLELQALIPEGGEGELDPHGKARVENLRAEIALLERRLALIPTTVAGGLKKGASNFVQSADEIAAAERVAEEALNGFADALARALQSPEDAGQALIDFFKSLVNTILQELTRLLVAKALLSIFPGLAAGSADGGPVSASGEVHGGMIGAKGYADGGGIHGPRPKGLDPRDTVPIWAQPGEFMQPARAVGYYGHRVMEAIRKREIPAGLLNALVSGPRLPSVPASRGIGFAEGGEVSGSTARPARSAAGDVTIEIRSSDVVADGLSTQNVRAVSPSIKEPRTLAEIKTRR